MIVFSYNKCLYSRFSIRFNITGYDYQELFQQKCVDSN